MPNAEQLQRDLEEIKALTILGDGISFRVEACSIKLKETKKMYCQLKDKIDEYLAKIQKDYTQNYDAFQTPVKAAKRYEALSLNAKLLERKIRRQYKILNLKGMIKSIGSFRDTLSGLEKVIDKTIAKNSKYSDPKEALESYKNIEIYSRYTEDCIKAMDNVGKILTPLVEKERFKNDALASRYHPMGMF